MSTLNIEVMTNGAHGIHDPGVAETVVVDRKEIVLPQQGGTGHFDIYSTTPFNVEVADGDFITLEVIPGAIIVHATPFDAESSEDTREATVKVTLVGQEEPAVEVAVKQTGVPTMNFSVTPTVVTVEGSSEDEKILDLFTVSGIEWRVTNISEWLSLSSYTGLTSEALTLTAKQNDTEKARTGEIEFKSGLSTFLVKVHQTEA